MFQYPPHLTGTHEPVLFHSLRSLGTVAPEYLPGDVNVSILVKRCPPAEDFIYYHPESVAIRTCRMMAVLYFRVEKLWAHPSGSTALCVRVRGCGVRDNRNKTEICEAGVAGFINQNVGLTN